ncbi:PhoH-like phosphate starvation-inducible [Bacillus phage vB_BanS_Chewbecca]|uniref:PhoH-like protein n=2 Tax=Tsamsavirus TaxID=3044849 RepID=A0AAE8YW97_9CAUD|nr:PhoH-like phosphate starvation-inducible [Bacillus phage vB_BanS_Skywalker]YP_010681354.1 PhoH-like phosphate starvation-inducible [Bacillus phage vB_BanS_Chewbecca]UGO46294.1 PhoH family protein [Bacillus phage vB_BanS_Chewbecca]UGO51206.1 PhoH-like protein [Bacillus phage vB_BanS_Skywalker]
MKFVVDTNALLRKPEVVFDFDCVIPSHVLREIEQLELKRKSDRTLQFEIRRLKKFLDENEDNPHVYIDIKDYKFTLEKEEDGFDSQYVDNILLQVCVDNGYGIITNDRLLKEKAKLYKIKIQKMDDSNYIDNKGFQDFSMSETGYNRMMETPDINHFGLMINEYAIVNNRVDGELLDIVKWTGTTTKSLRDAQGKLGAEFRTNQFGKFKPFDEHQIMAIDSIRSNQLTILRGRAGSGKSLITLNTAWRMVEEEGYKLVMFVNPTPLREAQELGFYKGDRMEKLMQSAVGTMLKSKFGDEQEIFAQILDNKLDILPFVDLRGWDSGDSKTIVWILEAQNLTADLMKLGLQRITENTKVVVDGDYFAQVDKDSYASNNGMKRMSEVFRGLDLFGEVELQTVHRSRVADIAELM